ncbi:MAG: hypothetical protein WDN04_09935 [Rhodospirillales bacterium]
MPLGFDGDPARRPGGDRRIHGRQPGPAIITAASITPTTRCPTRCRPTRRAPPSRAIPARAAAARTNCASRTRRAAREVFFNAQYDYNKTVLHNETVTITNDHTTTVKEGKRSITVSQGANELTVNQGDNKATISTGNDS